MQWAVYCRVVDNLGDIGVAWRLAADLAGRGERVVLACDDRTALAWLAPSGAGGVDVVGWDHPPAFGADGCDVVVELFGAGVPESVQARAAAAARPPLFVNVEHLSAERYVERSHRLASPRAMAGGAALTTWFFYPGFNERTGGLLREPGLLARRQAFGDGRAWLASLGVDVRAGERRVSLFCYENESLGALLDALAGAPTLLLATAGHAARQVEAALGPGLVRGALRAVTLAPMAQASFDCLLWSCDLNFVRGEDSLVRALWAGAPFVWQLYRQDDGAHFAKLAAFLDAHLAGAEPTLADALRRCFLRWNGAEPLWNAGAALALPPLDAWRRHCSEWRSALATLPDLTRRLIDFAVSER